ncbi:MAG: TIGR03960 family B12-binding radical SAM protein [Proteobacteria bacterium]|nr:TIGR03960 family B12-binding radical SAM protein [Pseudomonadota bacterium]
MGGEKNAVTKPPDRVRLRVALAFPDVYEVAMSHLGLEILYNILNQREDIAGERVFAPWHDLERHMRAGGIPLVSLESSRPLREFDLLGFSLQYELSFTNILNMLDLAGIPLYSRNRDEEFPLIIAGGPSTTNPEPIAEFFDAFVIGDGEEAILEICDRMIEGKQKGRSKRALLEDLTHIEGVYVPSFFQVTIRRDGTIKKITPLVAGYTHVRKRILKDIDSVPYPVTPIVPWLKTVHDRLSVEIARGCPRGCRFCHAGFIYRPYRERRPDRVEDLIKSSLMSTGYDEVSFLSLSCGDYSCIEQLLTRIMDCCQGDHVAVAFPSMRVETLTPEMAHQIKRVRKTGFTLAPEAATARLRKVINKEMDEEILLQVAKTLYEKGWNLIKLYFMIGLPTETDEDVNEIVRLARKVLDQGKGGGRPPRLNVSVSTFVPKPHTPFQWEAQLTVEATTLKQKMVQRGLKTNRVRFKSHNAKMSFLEGVFSRGDRRLSRVIHDAFTMGCRFDGWTESFQWELWCRAFEKNGIDMASYTRERSSSEILPWNHIQCSVSEKFLKRERERSIQATVTDPCREGCTACGVCDHENLALASWKMKDGPPRSLRQTDTRGEEPVKLLLEFQKVGPARLLGHLDMARAFHRAARRAGVPLRYSQGFHPAPRISFERALALGMESFNEQMTWELERPVYETRLRKIVNRELPPGLRITQVFRSSARQGLEHVSQKRNHYLVAFPEGQPQGLESRIRKFLTSGEWVIPRDRRDGQYDVRPHIETIFTVDRFTLDQSILNAWSELDNNRTGFVKVVLRKSEATGVRVDKALGSILSLSKEHTSQIRILQLD